MSLTIIFIIIVDLVQNDTLEERVASLETQVTVIQDDVTDLEVNLIELEGDVNFLFDEQVIQDERIFTLEQTSIETSEEVEGNCHLPVINVFIEQK